jgi:hypothetical protein
MAAKTAKTKPRFDRLPRRLFPTAPGDQQPTDLFKSLRVVDAKGRTVLSSAKVVLVLYAIAHHADHEDRAWPSTARLASMCELGERTVRYAIEALRRVGLLLVTHREGQSSMLTVVYEASEPRQLPAAVKDPKPAATTAGLRRGPRQVAADRTRPGTSAPPPAECVASQRAAAAPQAPAAPGGRCAAGEPPALPVTGEEGPPCPVPSDGGELPELTESEEYDFLEVVRQWPRWPRARMRAIAEARLAYQELLAAPGPLNDPCAITGAVFDYLAECKRYKVAPLRYLLLANFFRCGRWFQYAERREEEEIENAQGSRATRAALSAERERAVARRARRARESPLAALQAQREAAELATARLAAARAEAREKAALRLRGSALVDAVEDIDAATTEAALVAAIDGMEVEIEMHDAAASWRTRRGLAVAAP